MQDYKTFEIAPEEVKHIAARMRRAGRDLLMIHAHVQKDGRLRVSWDYTVGDCVESYYVLDGKKFPSIAEIYDAAAEWPELELYELYGLDFEGLDTSKRLFLPEDLLETQGRGQIMVTPLSELVEKRREKEEEE